MLSCAMCCRVRHVYESVSASTFRARVTIENLDTTGEGRTAALLALVPNTYATQQTLGFSHALHARVQRCCVEEPGCVRSHWLC